LAGEQTRSSPDARVSIVRLLVILIILQVNKQLKPRDSPRAVSYCLQFRWFCTESFQQVRIRLLSLLPAG